MFATNARMAGCGKLATRRPPRGPTQQRRSTGRRTRRGAARPSLIVGLLLGAQPLLWTPIAQAEEPAGAVSSRSAQAVEPDSDSGAFAGLDRPSAERAGHDRPNRRALKAKGKGLTYRDRVEDIEYVLQGTYGRGQQPLPTAVRLLKDPKLLRLRSVVGAGDFQFVGSLGSDLHPKRIGRHLDWQAVSRYDLGSWSVGLGYSHVMTLDQKAKFKGNAEQALHGAVGWSVSERVSASATAVAWEPWKGGGGKPSAMAAYLDLSFSF